MSPAEIARRFSELGDWIKGMITFDMELVRYYREHHGVNVLLRSQWIQQGGGLATKQAYYDGIHQIADDEALIVEFAVPDRCHYWQILVADDRFSTVDWVNRQSSLNDVQARVDPDGWFRAVVSKQDPGVHNWLDKADWPWGILQARFYQAEDYPEATRDEGARRRGARAPADRHSGGDPCGARGAVAAPTDRGPTAAYLVTHPHYLLTHLG